MPEQVQVPYAGEQSFARAPQGSLAELKSGQIAVLGVPFDGTSSHRQGVRLGPQYIREASIDLRYNLETAGTLTDVATGRTLTWPAKIDMVDLGDLAIFHTDVARSEEVISTALAATAASDAFPIVLGGDHHVTYPAVSGFALGLSRRQKQVGFIQVAGSLGVTLRRVLESRSVDPSNMVLLGVHGFVPVADWELAQESNVSVITSSSISDEGGVAAAAKRALDIAGRNCDSIYISVDVGVVDAAYAPGRGELGIGGLTPEDFLDLMAALSAQKVGALDVVEVAPPLDPAGRTSRLAAEGIIEHIGGKLFS